MGILDFWEYQKIGNGTRGRYLKNDSNDFFSQGWYINSRLVVYLSVLDVYCKIIDKVYLFARVTIKVNLQIK